MDLKGLNYYSIDGAVTRYSGSRAIRFAANLGKDTIHTFVSIDSVKTIQILESEFFKFNIVPLDSRICKVLYGKNT